MTQFDSSGSGSTCGKVGALDEQAAAAQWFTSVQEIATYFLVAERPTGGRFRGSIFPHGTIDLGKMLR
jgi:hypothetical protein